MCCRSTGKQTSPSATYSTAECWCQTDYCNGKTPFSIGYDSTPNRESKPDHCEAFISTSVVGCCNCYSGENCLLKRYEPMHFYAILQPILDRNAILLYLLCYLDADLILFYPIPSFWPAKGAYRPTTFYARLSSHKKAIFHPILSYS